MKAVALGDHLGHRAGQPDAQRVGEGGHEGTETVLRQLLTGAGAVDTATAGDRVPRPRRRGLRTLLRVAGATVI